GLDWPASLSRAKELISLVAGVQIKLGSYNAEIYSQDHALLLRNLERGKAGGVSGIWAWLSSPEYRCSRKLLRRLRSVGAAPVKELFVELEELKRQTRAWKTLAKDGSVPCLVTGFGEQKKKCDALFSEIDVLASIFPTKQVEQLAVDEVGNLLTALAS